MWNDFKFEILYSSKFKIISDFKIKSTKALRTSLSALGARDLVVVALRAHCCTLHSA